MTIEEYRAAILQALLDAKNEDGTPAITPREAQEALNGFTDDELQDGILWNSPEDVASIIPRGINHGSYIQLPTDKNRSKDPFCGGFAPIPIYTSCSFFPLKTVFNSPAILHFCCKSNKKLKNATKNKRMCNFSFTIQLLFVNLQPHKRKGNLQIPLQSV